MKQGELDLRSVAQRYTDDQRAFIEKHPGLKGQETRRRIREACGGHFIAYKPLEFLWEHLQKCPQCRSRFNSPRSGT